MRNGLSGLPQDEIEERLSFYSEIVPKSVTGGKCDISTDTGDIKINVTP